MAKRITVILIGLAMAVVSLGIDQGAYAESQKGEGPVPRNKGNWTTAAPVKNPTPSKDKSEVATWNKNTRLSKRNQMMIEVNEQARIRQANILAGK